ncbi:hypothetical protein [Caballeronia ptereochthonis]|uniref:Uncharacterized protein n=1 Tax=Caballeronia ptereochthonis TaxID=1777144 RepID=A0A158AIT4_9BURK|nr:hypothetical protein [Caballeronia ptereochthonis]SAK57645.1 hypothetical protein AWB83_01901 [Caballeronia ptereochthonis]
MENSGDADVQELQQNCAEAYALARAACESARTKAELDLAAGKQQDAFKVYRSAVAAREALTGI